MRFQIKAVRGVEGVTALALDAVDEADARARARAQGYVVFGVRAQAGSRFDRKRFPLLLFSQELIALLEAGLGLVEALEALAEKHQQQGARSVLEQVLERLYQGQTFSLALEQCPAAFPRLYVATVRASERTGDLPQALARFITYQVQVETLRSKLVTASIYPLLLILIGGAVTLFLLGYVVPKFSSIYTDLGHAQPLPSQLLMAFGTLINQHSVLVIALCIATLALGVQMSLSPRLRAWAAARLTALPGLAEKFRIVQIARLYRTAGMLLRGGIPAVTALDMVGKLLSPALRANLQLALREIREGKPLSGAMESHGLTTPVAVRMLRVGERTGDMGAMMERIARLHDDEIAQWVERTVRLFEPLLMIFIGLIIGIIVLALYMPIFDLAGSLQ